MSAVIWSALALCIGGMFAVTARGLTVDWLSSADTSYGIALAALACVVLYRRRSAIVRAGADRRTKGAADLAVLLAGLILYIVGQLSADVFLTRVSLPVVLWGATWFVAGRETARLTAAPLALLLLAIPPPTILLNAITMPLQLVASRIAEVLLSSSGVPVFRDGNILELPSTSLEVVEACSGLRSLVSLAAVAIVCGWATRQPPLLRLRLLAATIPIAVIVNGGRIAVTGVMCEIWGPRMAGGEWHTFTGWLTFMTGLVLLLALHRWWAPVDPHTLWDSQLVGA